MPTSRRKIEFQLYEQGGAAAMRGKMITAAGGMVGVYVSGSGTLNAITDKDGAALANPLALTNGAAEFYTLATVATVDLAIMCPGGQFVFMSGVDESLADIAVDTLNRNQMAKIGYSVADASATVEEDTGFDLPYNCVVQPWPGVLPVVVDATEDIDVGILSTETAGDADGFIDSVSVATAVYTKATLLAAGDTMGALLSVLDSANAGDDAPEPYPVVSPNGRSISYTLSAGSDTAVGYILLPYTLMS